jgi:hypothetical protein
MIPAYSPQARGRSERSFQTWQGRPPQELRLAGIKTVQEANQFLRQRYIAEFNQKFRVAAEKAGSAFIRLRRRDLDWVFSVQHERRVGQDNTVVLDNRIYQIAKTRWRDTLAGCRVMVHELADDSIAIRFGPHEVARFGAGEPVPTRPKPKGSPRPLGYRRAAA